MQQTGTLPNGNPKFREADVTITDGMVQPGGGTSLYDRDAFFKGKSWQYFLIPAGTEADPNIIFSGPDRNDFFNANHYQIDIKQPMFTAVYKGAMDNLARAAIAKAYEDARK